MPFTGGGMPGMPQQNPFGKPWRIDPRRATEDNPIRGLPPVTHNKIDFGGLANDLSGGILGPILGGILGPHYADGQGQMAPDSGPVIRKSWDDNPGADAGGGSIIDQLLALLGGNGGGQDMSGLETQARMAANAQYDPQIAALNRAMQGAQTRATRNKGELGNMYASLRQSDLADIPKINKIYSEGNADIKNQYKHLQDEVSGSYADTAAQQDALFKRLNLQAAAPDITAQQNSDQNFFKGQQGQSQQDTMDAMKMLQQGSVDFSQQGAEIAGLEGTNAQTDLMSQLEQYLQDTTGKIGDLEGAKEASYMSQLAGLQNSASGAYRQQQNDLFNHMLDIAKLQQSGINGSAGTTYREGPLAASQYLGQNADPQQASQLNGFLLDVLQDPSIARGEMPGIMGGQTIKLTPETAAQMAQQKAAAAGMSEQSQKAIYMAMLAYFGRMY